MPKVVGVPTPRFNADIKKGKAYISLIFRYRGHFLKITTCQIVKASLWDAKAQRVKMDRTDTTAHVLANDVLKRMAAAAADIYRENNFGQIEPEAFRHELVYRMDWAPRPEEQPEPAAPGLFDFIENTMLPEKRAQPRGTWKILQTVFFLLRQYATDRRGGRLDYDDIDFSFFADFKAWLYAAPRSHSINYAAKVVDVLKQFMRDAQRRHYHTKTDYQSFSIKKVKTTKVALSFDELEALYSLDLSGNPRLEKVRDLFLIGAYTGLRFSDFTRIRPEHIEVVDGRAILTITTQKTGETVSIPLLPIPAALLRKYDFKTPTLSNQKMNDYLKELGNLAGMTGKMIVTNTAGGKRSEQVLEKWERLTTHVARRSFATNFYRDGVPAVVLMKITGHTTERQFMQYVAIDGKANALHFADLRKGEAHPLKAVS